MDRATIESRITKLTDEVQAIVANANSAVAFRNGQIALLRELLDDSPPTADSNAADTGG